MSEKNTASAPRFDVIVIGAGFAGLSTAWCLARKGVKRIAVLEHDDKLGGHASGRNAGMIRQAIADPVIAGMAAEGRKLLGKCRQWGWKGVRLEPNGSLLLAQEDQIEELERTAKALRHERLAYRWYSHQDAVRHVRLLEDGAFERGLFCPSDAMVDIEALLQGFYRQLKRSGVAVKLGCTLRRVQKKKDGFHVTAGGQSWIAQKVVNAAGAWAGAVARRSAASKVPLKAYRRHLFISKPFDALDRSWPFVWDLSHNFYFRPQGPSLLLSACDKTEVKNVETAVRKETIDPRVQTDLFGKLDVFSDKFKAVRIQSAKSGLRTMAPDGRFVIGEDPKLQGFFWVAGLGGHGVTTSFAVGNLASDLVLGKKRKGSLAAALSPARFFKKGK